MAEECKHASSESVVEFVSWCPECGCLYSGGKWRLTAKTAAEKAAARDEEGHLLPENGLKR